MYQSTHYVFIDIEMCRHFGKLNTCVHAHERIVLCSGQSPQDQWCV